MVWIIFKNIYVLVYWTKVASALEGLIAISPWRNKTFVSISGNNAFALGAISLFKFTYGVISMFPYVKTYIPLPHIMT